MINMKDLSKPLDIKDVDVRVSRSGKTQNGAWCILLAYKDARVDMKRLDEVCTPLGWQRDHKEIKGVVYCGIGVNKSKTTEYDQWVWKWDAGSESFSEKQKGEASDSFKRAGFNWGIGRELYDYPTIFINLNNDEYKEKDGKITPKIKPNEWTWGIEVVDGEILKLAAKDKNGSLRFNYKK